MLYVNRAGWGARPPKSIPTKLSASAVDYIFQHYSAADADEQSDHARCAGRVKGIQTYHMAPGGLGVLKGGNDIGYSFLTCKHGWVFEGRGLGVQPGATGSANSHSLAVCFLGDDTENRDDVTRSGRQALIDVYQLIERWANKELKYGGHRDVMGTKCPGDQLYGYVTSAAFAERVRVVTEDALRRRTGFYSWAAWRLGEEDWQPYGPMNPAVRPDVPMNIVLARPTWFPRLAAMLAARKM